MAGGLDKFECDRGFLTLKKHNLNQTKQTAIVYKSQTVKLANKMKKPPGLFPWKTLFRLLGRQ